MVALVGVRDQGSGIREVGCECDILRCKLLTGSCMKGLTDIPGIRVGHVSDFDALTGCTAILCEKGAVGGVDIRGSASGTQETPAISPAHADPVAHGILLAGGSAFGLEAASGVRRYLE